LSIKKTQAWYLFFFPEIEEYGQAYDYNYKFNLLTDYGFYQAFFLVLSQCCYFSLENYLSLLSAQIDLHQLFCSIFRSRSDVSFPQ
jgi:hypothetical protein